MQWKAAMQKMEVLSSELIPLTWNQLAFWLAACFEGDPDPLFTHVALRVADAAFWVRTMR